MELLTFKTLWGYPDVDRAENLRQACREARAQNFDGVEGQIPADDSLRHDFAEYLGEFDLRYIAEITTAGSYVPDRTATLENHLKDLELQLSRLYPLRPEKVTCLGGCDRWDIETSIAFFTEGLALAEKYNQKICFETHRGRSLYSPWVTEKILQKIALPLTCDFSHWCVVCEGLGDSEQDLMGEVAAHAQHIHGRIGFDQGPQVSDPRSFLYRADLDKHLLWWSWIWQAQSAGGLAITTLTPEFGPDGYQAVDPDSGEPLGDLDDINLWMANTVRAEFNSAYAHSTIDTGDTQ